MISPLSTLPPTSALEPGPSLLTDWHYRAAELVIYRALADRRLTKPEAQVTELILSLSFRIQRLRAKIPKLMHFVEYALAQDGGGMDKSNASRAVKSLIKYRVIQAELPYYWFNGSLGNWDAPLKGDAAKLLIQMMLFEREPDLRDGLLFTFVQTAAERFNIELPAGEVLEKTGVAKFATPQGHGGRAAVAKFATLGENLNVDRGETALFFSPHPTVAKNATPSLIRSDLSPKLIKESTTHLSSGTLSDKGDERFSNVGDEFNRNEVRPYRNLFNEVLGIIGSQAMKKWEKFWTNRCRDEYDEVLALIALYRDAKNRGAVPNPGGFMATAYYSRRKLTAGAK